MQKEKLYNIAFISIVICASATLIYYEYTNRILLSNLSSEIEDYERELNQEKKRDVNLRRQSDPLGQDARSLKSIPIDTHKKIIITTNLIKKMQLILKLDGYYSGNINGTVDAFTRDSILKYKSEHDLLGGVDINKPFLISLGLWS